MITDSKQPLRRTSEFLVPAENLEAVIKEMGLNTGKFSVPCTFLNCRILLAAENVGPIPDSGRYYWNIQIRALPKDQFYPTVPRWLRLGPKGRAAHNKCGILTALFAQNDEIRIDIPVASHLGLHGTFINGGYPTQSTLDFVLHQWQVYMEEVAKYKICEPIADVAKQVPEPATSSVPVPVGAFA